ncbi:MAG TPA: hypothetical protein VFN49_06625 [Candidatus Aquilonibacter sp.]|nr:hypothetical protein [Candidatus Aquilonibacter sp.]
MKSHYFVAIALTAAFVAAPLHVNAAQEAASTGGTVCGRVDAAPSYIFQLQQQHPHDNIIVARSSTEEVQAPVNIDGTYCFRNLHPDLHTLVAFEDAFETRSASVTPVAGQTLIVDLTPPNAGI